MRLPIALLPLLALTAAAPAQQGYPSEPAARLRGISMEVRSWGRPVAAWAIDAQGNGTRTTPEPDVHNATTLATRRFAVGTAGFRKLRVMLGGPEMRGTAIPCMQRITDQIYGSVTWTRYTGRLRTLRFDNGCQDLGARRVLGDIAKADALVAEWAAAGAVVQTRPVERR
jgi:hypothetical protein